ncbi:MAG: biotin--[acetyl-CoA-carboxylase] ligase [Gammaproteobacteria bacterium]
MSDALLRLAAALPAGDYRPGARLARELGLSGPALRQGVARLRALGLAVEGLPGQGYRVSDAMELLDSATLRQRLSPSALRALGGIEVVASIDSTNSEMLRRSGDRFHAVALFAEHQGGGRGRRERRWHSPFARNLYLSVGWHYDRPPADLASLSLAVAVTVAEALESAGLPTVALKWPNDLLLDERKVGGMLVESRQGRGGCRVVVGVGINVRMGDDPGAAEIDQPWTDLANHDPQVSRNAVAAILLEGLLPALAGFEDTGFFPFRDRWSARDALRGRRVTLYREGEAISGRAVGLGPGGGLLLDTGAGSPLECCAGEITSHAP